MNYIRELNAFYDWLESNPCPSDAIALWCALMSISNKASWPEEFTVANTTLQTKAGLSRQKLDRWRNFMVQKGRFEYQKSKKVNEAGTYKLISFYPPIVQNDTQNDTQDDTQNSTQNDTQDVIQNVHINKLNKTKQKQNAHDPNFEQFWTVYPRKVGKGRALAQWQARRKEESAETLIRCAENYAARCKYLKTEEQFIKHPSTFLSAKGDYLDFAAAPASQSEKPEFVKISDEERERMREFYRKQAERNLACTT